MCPITFTALVVGFISANAATIASMATSLVLGVVSNLLFGKPVVGPDAPKPSLSTTVRGATEARKVIYGEMLTGGVLVYAETSPPSDQQDANRFLNVVVALAGHQSDSISEIWLDDKISTDPQFTGSGGTPLVLVSNHLGSASQTADTALQAAIPAWDATHRLRGVTYIYAQLRWQNDPVTFRSGIPNLRAKVKGALLYDPRTSNAAWSNNPALCVRDWLTASYGFGCSSAEVDDALIIAAANICDEVVGGQARYTCDGVISLDEKPLDVLDDLLASMAGACVYSQGKFRVYAGADRAKTVTIDRSILRGDIQVDPRLARQDLFNAVRGTFTNPTMDWQSADFPPVTNATYTAQDGEQIYRDITLRFTVDSTQVRPQRIAKIHLENSRQGIKATLPCTFAALQIAPWDIIGVTEPLLGWVDKSFIVLQWTLAEGGGVDLLVQEYSAASYNWSNGDATVIDPAPDTNLNNPFNVGPPGTPSVVETLIETRQGAGVASLATITWGRSPDAFAFRYRVGYKPHAATTWITAGETQDRTFAIQDLAAGTYDFRVAAINQFGTTSAYSTTTLQLLGLTARPGDVAGLTITVLNGQAQARWTRAVDLDVLHGGWVRFRHSPATSGATWASSIDLAQVAGSAQEATLPAITGTYLAKFVDSTGNISLNEAALATTLPDLIGYNAVLTQTESPGFAGTKVNTAVAGSILHLAGDFLPIDTWSLIDGWGAVDANAGVLPSGTYAFASKIDLGAVYTSRVTANIVVSVVNVLNLLDARTGLVDSWDNFDGVIIAAVANAVLEVRTTPDDPAGSPTWGPWNAFVIGNYTARGFDFRLTLTSDDPTYNIEVSTLAVTIDMPDRRYAVSSTSSAAANVTITFPSPFKATPKAVWGLQGAATGDYVDLVSVSTTTCVYSVRNSAAARVAKNVDFTFVGY